MGVKNIAKKGLLCLCILVVECIVLSGCDDNSANNLQVNSPSNLLPYLGMQYDLAEKQLKENGYIVYKPEDEIGMSLFVSDYKNSSVADMLSSHDDIDVITIKDNVQSVNFIGITIGMTAENAINILKKKWVQF